MKCQFYFLWTADVFADVTGEADRAGDDRGRGIDGKNTFVFLE